MRLMAVKAVSVEEKRPDNNKNAKKVRILTILTSNKNSHDQIIHAWPINKNAKEQN